MPRGAPDLARTIYLLWGHHPSPGRSGLTVSAIVRAGIELADAEGLDAVSMRKVADRLGVGAMSLYGHVPGKDDLTALMVDSVYGELYDNDVEAATRVGDWRAAMRFVAARNWALYERHPWLFDIRSARPSLGPNLSRKYETELRPLDGIGLPDVEMDAALTLVLSHVDSTARAHRNVSRTRAESGMSDAEWWAAVAPVLEQVMVDDELVLSARVGGAVGARFDAAQSPEHALAFGLDTILDGIEARIAEFTTTRPDPGPAGEAPPAGSAPPAPGDG
ncbi:TetR/AcrR family transcriptional regulator [Actinophytocola gossypii]|uniref:TetR/AcrR family transcriptional regulator n=1 Tax=Actinophytocola gossypii TaxID=2812003 RepID=UPI0021A4FE06|nr:TetR/AcrR family transcriptional regulator [Actinophytocola gossypii]